MEKWRNCSFLLFSTIFFYLLLDFYVLAATGFSLRDKRLFEISEFEITEFNCIPKGSSFIRSWISIVSSNITKLSNRLGKILHIQKRSRDAAEYLDLNTRKWSIPHMRTVNLPTEPVYLCNLIRLFIVRRHILHGRESNHSVGG